MKKTKSNQPDGDFGWIPLKISHLGMEESNSLDLMSKGNLQYLAAIPYFMAVWSATEHVRVIGCAMFLTAFVSPVAAALCICIRLYKVYLDLR